MQFDFLVNLTVDNDVVSNPLINMPNSSLYYDILEESCGKTGLLSNQSALTFTLKQSFYVDICGILSSLDVNTVEKSILNAWLTTFPGKESKEYSNSILSLD